MSQKKYTIPDAVREGRQAYKLAMEKGEEIPADVREANREYFRIRWGQLDPIERQRVIQKNNAKRTYESRKVERERLKIRSAIKFLRDLGYTVVEPSE